MHDTLFRWTTVVADAWQNIALVTLIGTVGALRRRVRALEGAKAVSPPASKLRALLRDWRGFLACFRIRCPKCNGFYHLPGEVAAMGGRQCRCEAER